MTNFLLFWQLDFNFWIEAVKTVGYPIVSAICFWLVIRQNNQFFQRMIERGEENEKAAQQHFLTELRTQRNEMMEFIRERDAMSNAVLTRVADSLELLKDAIQQNRPKTTLKAI